MSDRPRATHRCPECGAEQPEPGTCGRCPGTVQPLPFSALREKAERAVIFPLNRDECLALIAVAEAAVDYQAKMSKIATDWRMDWSDFDGRTLMHQESGAGEQLNRALAALKEIT